MRKITESSFDEHRYGVKEMDPCPEIVLFNIDILVAHDQETEYRQDCFSITIMVICAQSFPP